MLSAADTTKQTNEDPDVEGRDPTDEASRPSQHQNLENNGAEDVGESNHNNDNDNKNDDKASLTARDSQSRLSSNILFDGSPCRTCEPTTLPTTQDEENETSLCWRIARRMCQFYWNNEFACSVVVAVLLAWIYPPLGADYLVPKITSTWIAVMLIFSEYLFALFF